MARGSKANVSSAALSDMAGHVWRPRVDPKLIERTFSELRALQISATLELVIATGRTIIETLYGGDFTAWRRHGRKEASLRQLASRFRSESHGLSAAALHRAIAIYELDRRYRVSARKHLTVTHLRAIAATPLREQERLLCLVENGAWSTRTLEAEIARGRSATNGRRVGRPPLSPAIKIARRLAADLADLEAATRSAMSASDWELLRQSLGTWRSLIVWIERNGPSSFNL